MIGYEKLSSGQGDVSVDERIFTSDQGLVPKLFSKYRDLIGSRVVEPLYITYPPMLGRNAACDRKAEY